jgi:hypothetical protein
MPNRTREIGTATLGGMVVGGIISTALSIANVTLATAIGAFVGGVVAAYVLYGNIREAAIAGGLSGVLGVPFFLGVEQILLIFEVIPIPPGPTPPLSELQAALAVIAGMDLVAGALGGTLLGGVYRPKPVPPPLQPSVTPGVQTPLQVRYCVQCGAKLQPGTLICPYCSARQPQ